MILFPNCFGSLTAPLLCTQKDGLFLVTAYSETLIFSCSLYKANSHIRTHTHTRAHTHTYTIHSHTCTHTQTSKSSPPLIMPLWYSSACFWLPIVYHSSYDFDYISRITSFVLEGTETKYKVKTVMNYFICSFRFRCNHVRFVFFSLFCLCFIFLFCFRNFKIYFFPPDFYPIRYGLGQDFSLQTYGVDKTIWL